MGWGHGGDGEKAIIAGLEWGQKKYCGAEMGTILLPRGGGGKKMLPVPLYTVHENTRQHAIVKNSIPVLHDSYYTKVLDGKMIMHGIMRYCMLYKIIWIIYLV